MTNHSLTPSESSARPHLAKTIVRRLRVTRRDIEDYAEFLRAHLGKYTGNLLRICPA